VTALSATVASVFGDSALFTAQGGTAISVIAVCAYHNDAVGLGPFEIDVRSPGHEARIGQATLGTRPAKGDTLQILAGPHLGTYALKDVAEDLERSEWICDLGG
jgi:hypothetical protein